MTKRAWASAETPEADCDCVEDARDGDPAGVNAVTPAHASAFAAPVFSPPVFSAPSAPRAYEGVSYPAYAPFVPIAAAEAAGAPARPNNFFIPTSIQNRHHSPRPYMSTRRGSPTSASSWSAQSSPAPSPTSTPSLLFFESGVLSRSNSQITSNTSTSMGMSPSTSQVTFGMTPSDSQLAFGMTSSTSQLTLDATTDSSESALDRRAGVDRASMDRLKAAARSAGVYAGASFRNASPGPFASAAADERPRAGGFSSESPAMRILRRKHEAAEAAAAAAHALLDEERRATATLVGMFHAVQATYLSQSAAMRALLVEHSKTVDDLDELRRRGPAAITPADVALKYAQATAALESAKAKVRELELLKAQAWAQPAEDFVAWPSASAPDSPKGFESPPPGFSTPPHGYKTPPTKSKSRSRASKSRHRASPQHSPAHTSPQNSPASDAPRPPQPALSPGPDRQPPALPRC
ncbi:hypothetical protein M885DRAFT_513401 [Pelagophyceae sp. CCMP2097]|nr:hypothetical protein M885DRAFT_513401 [Pelagophyceae sp. CCMP2097]